MGRPDWKGVERQIASRLGGQRVPVSGRGRGDAPDVRHPLLSIECKTRQSLPSWLHTAMAQAVASAGPDQLPIAVLHQVGQRHNDDLVVMGLSSLTALLAEIPARHIPREGG